MSADGRDSVEAHQCRVGTSSSTHSRTACGGKKSETLLSGKVSAQANVSGRDHRQGGRGDPRRAALATPSHGIAASRGYPDGEKIPRDLMISEVGLIVRTAGDLPVTADLEGGYGDPGGTVAAAIEVGAVGCNLEDKMKPLDESAKAVEAAVAAAERPASTSCSTRAPTRSSRQATGTRRRC